MPRVWYRYKDMPSAMREAANLGEHTALEAFISPAGTTWYRQRGEQEAADLARIEREHHPDFAHSGEGKP